MAKKPTTTTVASGFYSTTTLNNNFTALRDAFDNTLSLDGSTPNAMNADLDMNSNDLLNVGEVDTSNLKIRGVTVTPTNVQFLQATDTKDSVADLLADTTFTYTSGTPNTIQVAAGDILRTLAEGFAYEVAASAATDQHVTTAGGVKLYVQKNVSGYDIRAFGVLDVFTVGNDASVNTIAINAALSQAALDGGGTVRGIGRISVNDTIYIPSGVFLESWGGLGPANLGYDSGLILQFPNVTPIANGGVFLGDVSNPLATGGGMRGVHVFGVVGDGIVVQRNAMIIDNCMVSYCHGSGIVTLPGSSVCQLFRTQVVGSSLHGIVLGAADNRVLECEVQQPNRTNGTTVPAANSYDCIHITSAGPQQIIGCRMGDDAFLSRDAIRQNVTGTAGGLQIIGNDLQNFVQAGIRFANTSTSFNNSILGNRIVSSSVSAEKSGIRFDSAASASSIVGNSFNGIAAGGRGAFYFAAAVENSQIRGNSFFGNWRTNTSSYAWVDVATRLLSGRTSQLDDVGADIGPHRNGCTLTGATPDVRNGASANFFWLNNSAPTNVTDFANGFPGLAVTVVAANANSTLVHSSGLRLAGGLNWAMPTGASITLQRGSTEAGFGEVWVEVARSHPNGVSTGGAGLIRAGTGSPEGVVTAPVGTLYQRLDGGAGTTLYVKETGTGNTGWVAK